MDKKISKVESKKRESNPNTLRSVKGMHDVLPAEQPWWERVERQAKELADFYGFNKIDTPLLESVDLFMRTVGADSDIVQKEMYTLKTRGGSVLALRPEATASVTRAYIEHSLGRISQPQKLFYMGPMFRHENPQLGRLRQFSQVGFEVIGGTDDSIYDAQVIIIFDRFLKNLKIRDISLKINSIGCRVCRPGYKRQLQTYYKTHEKALCEDCKRRLKTNPLRLLDCKNKECQPFKEKAPNFLDKICAQCSRHFKGVLEYLDEVELAYELDNQLVRGLDYYNRTVFEMSAGDGVLGVLAAGGRYDYLADLLGNRTTPAIGGAVGFERIIETMKAQEIKLPVKPMRKVFIVHVGELAKKKSLRLIEDLRVAGIPISESLGKESIKAQLKVADKQKNTLALIFGQKEIYEESVIIRDLRTGLQETVFLAKLVPEIQKRLKEKIPDNS